MVTVPALASLSAMVRGMRSPFSSLVRTTNWPALALRAMRGASNLKRWILGTRVFANNILYSLLTPEFGQSYTALPQLTHLTETSFFIIPYFPVWRQVKTMFPQLF